MSNAKHSKITRREFLAKTAATAVGAGIVGSAGIRLIKPLPALAAPTRLSSRPLVFAVKTEALTLDPHQNDFVYTQYAQRPVYEPLVDYTSDGKGGAKVIPLLATEWAVTEGGKSYVFKIRPGVRFSDGTPLDAEAVKWNFDRALAVNKGPAARLRVIDRVEIVDPLTVRFILKSPLSSFVEALGKTPYMVSPTAQGKAQGGDLAQRWLNENTVGTGPYLLEEWVRGQHVTFTRNPNYWRGWRGQHVDRVIVRLVRESTTQRLMLEAGEADLADGLSILDAQALKTNPAVVIGEHEAPSLVQIMMRMRGQFLDPKFRQAMRAAFGYSSFVGGVLQNKGRIPNGPLPKGVWAHDPTLPQFRRELVQARRLLDEVGPSQRKFVLQTISPFFPHYLQLAQIFQQNLAELGLTLTIDDIPSAATFLGNLANPDRGPDMFGWVIIPVYDDPHGILFPNYHTAAAPPAGFNLTYYKNSRVDELIDGGLSAADRNVQRRHYNEVQRVLRDDGPAVFAAQFFLIVGSSKRLRGFVPHPFLLSSLSPDFYELWIEA